MPRKPSKKTLRRKADKLWSQLILSKGRCEVCGKKGTNPHHLIGRKNLALRHDPKNGVCLCYTHHVGGKESAHNDPIWFLNWFKSKRPKDYEYLIQKRNDIEYSYDYEKAIKRLEVRK